MTTPKMSLVTMSGEDNGSHVVMNGSMLGGDVMEEQLWFQYVYLGYLWTALIIGLPGNILIAVVYMTVQQKRTSDWFIFFLSVYDCAVCVFAVPLYLSIETGVWVATGSDLACKIEQFTIFTAQFSSVSILGIIAVDRYLKICLPTRRSLNATQARNIGICTPLIAALVAAPVLVWDGNVEHKFCRLQERYKNTLGVKIHRCSTFGFFVCMFFVVIYCYAHVCIVVRKRIQRHRENAMKRKHLMQIPAFLQAISNVDDPTGHASGRVHRSKRKFSLFSLGSSRRLSAISPWVKARLSLPNESIARNMGLPMDGVELESKESLAESKKKLDQALKLRGQAGVRSLNYKEKKELFKEHIEKLKDRKRADKERNERQDVIEELSGNEDSDKQIKEDMRTLDKIFSTSEFTLANCSAHKGVIEQWRKIFSSPRQRETSLARQYAGKCEISVESHLSDIGHEVSEVSVNTCSNSPNTCVVSVHLESNGKSPSQQADISDNSSDVLIDTDGNEVCGHQRSVLNIGYPSDNSGHIQQKQEGNQINDEKTAYMSYKDGSLTRKSNSMCCINFIPEIPEYRQASVLLDKEHHTFSEKYRCQGHHIPYTAQQKLFTQHLTPNYCCHQPSPLGALNQNKTMSESQDFTENSHLSRRAKLYLSRSCQSVSYRVNSCGHKLGHDSSFSRKKPFRSLKQLPFSTSPLCSRRQLQHASVPETQVAKKTTKSDLDSEIFCNKISGDPDIGALYSQRKKKSDYSCLNIRGSDATLQNYVRSKSEIKSRHITEGLVLACKRNPLDSGRFAGKFRSKSPESRPCRSLSSLDLYSSVVKNSNEICICQSSCRSDDVAEFDHKEVDLDDCTVALLGDKKKSGKSIDMKCPPTPRATTMRGTKCPYRALSVCEDKSYNKYNCGEITQALISNHKGITYNNTIKDQGRSSSGKHLNEKNCPGSDVGVRDYNKNQETGRESDQWNQMQRESEQWNKVSKSVDKGRRLKHQEAVEEYFEDPPEREAGLNYAKLKLKEFSEKTHRDLDQQQDCVPLLGRSNDRDTQQTQADNDEISKPTNGITTVRDSTSDQRKKYLELDPTIINIYSRQQDSINKDSNEASLTDHHRTINDSTHSLTGAGVIDRVDDCCDVTNVRGDCLPFKSCDTAARERRSDIGYAIQHATEHPFLTPMGAFQLSHLKNGGMEVPRTNLDGSMWVSGSTSETVEKSIEGDILCPGLNSSNREFCSRQMNENTENTCHVIESRVENNGSSSFRVASPFYSTESVLQYSNARTLADSHAEGQDMGLSQSNAPNTCSIVTGNNKNGGLLHPLARSELMSSARDSTLDDTKRELTNQRDLVINPHEGDFNNPHHGNAPDVVDAEQSDVISRTAEVTGNEDCGSPGLSGIQGVDRMCLDNTTVNSPVKYGVVPEIRDNMTRVTGCSSRQQACNNRLHTCNNKQHPCLQHAPNFGRHYGLTEKHKGFGPSIDSTVDSSHDIHGHSLKYRSDLDKSGTNQENNSCADGVCSLPGNNQLLTNCLDRNILQDGSHQKNELKLQNKKTDVHAISFVQDRTSKSSGFAVNVKSELSGRMVSSFFTCVGSDVLMSRNQFIPVSSFLLTRPQDSIYCPNCLYNEPSTTSIAQRSDINMHPLCPFWCDCFLGEEFHQHYSYRGFFSSLIERTYTNNTQLLREYPEFDEETCHIASEDKQRCRHSSNEASSSDTCHEKSDCKLRSEIHACRSQMSNVEGQQGMTFLTFISNYTLCSPIKCDFCLVQILHNYMCGKVFLSVDQVNNFDYIHSESKIINEVGYNRLLIDNVCLANTDVTLTISNVSKDKLEKSNDLPTLKDHFQVANSLSQPVLIYNTLNSSKTLKRPSPQTNCFSLQLIEETCNVCNIFNFIRSSAYACVPQCHEGDSFHRFFKQNQTNCIKVLYDDKLQNITHTFLSNQNNYLPSFTYLDCGKFVSRDYRHDLLNTTLMNVVCIRCFHISCSVQQAHNTSTDDVNKCHQVESHHELSGDFNKYKLVKIHQRLSEDLFPLVNQNTSKYRYDLSEDFFVPDADRSCHVAVNPRESLTPPLDLGNWTPPSLQDATCKIVFQSEESSDKLRCIVSSVIDGSHHKAHVVDDSDNNKHLKSVHSPDDGCVSHEAMCSFQKHFNSMNSIVRICSSPSHDAKGQQKKEEKGTINHDNKIRRTESEKLSFCGKKIKSPTRSDDPCVSLPTTSDQVGEIVETTEKTKSFPKSEKFLITNGISPKSQERSDTKRILMNADNQYTERCDQIENSETELGLYLCKSSSSALVPYNDDPVPQLQESLSDSSTGKLVPEFESQPSSCREIPLISVDNCTSVCLLGGTLAPLASHFNKFTKVINENQLPPFSLTIQNKKSNTENASSTADPLPRPSVLGRPSCDLTAQINTTNAIHSTLLKCVPTYSVSPALKPKDTNKPHNETCAFFVKSVFDAFFLASEMSSSSEPCLHTAREDEEIYEFPLFPLSSGNLDAPDFSKRKGNVYHIPDPSRLSSGNRSPWKTSSRSSGISHSWYSLNDLDPTNKPTLLRNSRFMYLTAIRRQLNNVFSPKSIRQFFGISDSPTLKKSGNKTIPRDRLSTNHINVIITRCESLVMDKSEDELPPMRSRVTLDPTCMDKGSRSSNDSVYYYNNGAGSRSDNVTTPKPRASSLDTTHSSVSRSDDQSLHSRSQDTSFDRSRGCSLDLLSPASASLRTGSMCSGISSMSRLTECSAYTEHSRSDCEKITRRSAEREHNITRLLGVITMIFVISWSVSWGVILYNTLSVVPVADSSHVVLSLPRDLFLINHFCNIIVYTILSRSFRDKLSQCYTSVKIC